MIRWNGTKRSDVILNCRRFSFIAFAVFVLSFLLYSSTSWADSSDPKTKVQEILHIVNNTASSKKSNQSGIKRSKTKFTIQKIGKQTFHVSPVMRSNINFDYIGLNLGMVSAVSKSALKDSSFQLRTFDGKNWSDWKAVEIDLENHESSQTEVFSHLIYTKNATSVQYRFTSKDDQNLLSVMTSIELTLLDTEQGPNYVKKPPIANKPNVVTREEWGADESLRYKNQDFKQGLKERQRYKRVTHLVVHHTAQNLLPGQSPEGYLRAVYYFHTVTRGWADIGYNALIGPDGTVYEGRKGFSNHPLLILNDGVAGAHAKGFNTGSFGVSLIGDFDEKPLPEAMRKSLVQLLAYEADFWNIDPTGHSDFKRSGDYDKNIYTPVDRDVPNITGHGLLKYNDTECPGKYVKDELEQIKLDVKKQFDLLSDIKK